MFIDNFYCNPALCDALAADNTMVVGTVRAKSISLPKDLIQQLMNKGDMDFRRKNQLVVIRWKDKRDVHLLKTKHTPAMQEHTTRTETKQKPTAVIDYIKNMAGVDLSDQLLSYMPFHCKTVKWWKKLAFHLLTLIFIQTHILQQMQETSWPKNLETREGCPHSLLLIGSKKKRWLTCPASGTCSSK